MQDGHGSATADPSPSTPVPHRKRLHTRRRLVWGVFLVSAAVIALCAAPYSPFLQERRLSHASLPALAREAGDSLGKVNDARLLYYLGLRLNQQQRFQEADPVLRRGVGISPHEPRLRDEWARALLGSGLTTAAFGELREFAGTHPDLAQAHLILGKFYFTERSMRRASEEFTQAIQRDPVSGEAWAFLSAAEQSLGNSERARQAAQQAIALRRNIAEDHLLYATLLAEANQPDKAREEYARAVALAPQQARMHREYAVWLLEAGKGEGDLRLAEAEASRATALAPEDAAAQRALGSALMRRGQIEAAHDPLKRAATLETDDPIAPALLGQVCAKLGRLEEARQWEKAAFERQAEAAERQKVFEALRVAPTSAALHTRMAHLLGKQGDVAGCVHSHATALRCAIDAPPALIAAANDLTDGGHPTEALPMARRAVSISPANPGAHEALGNALLGLGHADLAGQEYNKTASWWPHEAPIMRKRLERFSAERAAHPPPSELAYREARRLEHQNFGPKRMTPEVEAYAQKAVSLEPSNPNYLWYLFGIQMAQRENDPAISTARQLLRLVPKDARTHAMLALLLVEKASRPEEFTEVETHLQAADADPASGATRHYVLGLLAMRRQQGSTAVQELRTAAHLDPSADVTLYKLAQAEQTAGNTVAAQQVMAEYDKRQDSKRREAEALSDIGQHSDRPEVYEKAARIFDAHKMYGQARAIRAEAQRRFHHEPIRKDTPKTPAAAP